MLERVLHFLPVLCIRPTSNLWTDLMLMMVLTQGICGPGTVPGEWILVGYRCRLVSHLSRNCGTGCKLRSCYSCTHVWVWAVVTQSGTCTPPPSMPPTLPSVILGPVGSCQASVVCRWWHYLATIYTGTLFTAFSCNLRAFGDPLLLAEASPRARNSWVTLLCQ